MYRISGAHIEFAYKSSDLLDKVMMFTQYPVRSQKKDELTEELMVSEEEQDLVNNLLGKSLDAIFQTAYKLSLGVTDSIFKNAVKTWDSEFTGFGFSLVDKQGYNPNLLPMIDGYIESLLVSYVVQKWFMITRQIDLAKEENQTGIQLALQYNNALTELYKPKISAYQLTPSVSIDTIEVTVDPESGAMTITESVPTTITSDMQEIIHKDTFNDFPDQGLSGFIYSDDEKAQLYIWDGAKYKLYSGGSKTYEEAFYDKNSLTCIHNLNKEYPNVKMIGSDGIEYEVTYDPIDFNSGTTYWGEVTSGKLYFD